MVLYKTDWSNLGRLMRIGRDRVKYGAAPPYWLRPNCLRRLLLSAELPVFEPT